MAQHSLEKKVVVIAGGAKNLGGLVARDFAERGVSAIAIHYHSDSSKAAADETAEAVEKLGAPDLPRPS